MALNREDKKDVKNHLGKALASKVSDATRDHSGKMQKGGSSESIKRIKKAGSEYSPKHSMFTKKGYENNKKTIAKNKALKSKSGDDPYGVKGHAKMFKSPKHKAAVAKGKNEHINRRKYESED